MRLQWTKIAQTALLSIGIAALLAACTDTGQTPVAEPPQEQDEIGNTGQTLTVVPPDNSTQTTSDTAEYQIQTRLTDFQLLNDNGGLAWGVTRNALRLYYTQDQGVTWTNISPSENVQFPANPQYGQSIYFVDRTHGWIVREGLGGTDTMVLRTNNGGVSWSLSSLSKTDKVTAISFVSPEKGWILTTMDTSIGKQDKKLYVTEDGGITWKEMSSSDEDDQPASAEIPTRGYTTGLTFSDPKHGFLTALEFGTPKLYITTDGGENWKTGPTFFDRNDFNGCGNFNIGSPQFFGREAKGAWMPLTCSSGDYTKFNGYFTDDGGKSWTLSTFGLNKQKGINRNLTPAFLNASEGWVVQSGTTYQTKDSGKSWKALPGSKVLDGILEDYPEIVKLQMVSSKLGWILVENTDTKRSLLLQTVDGGLQWKVL
ncbi:VPS10 domain-containing protein [Paenibacillus illinoisensis]|uniref:WD40/YVTN/BNR-like repeat-containing protein n=1 Tax=Paenibacillus illinoisensis TaxID=59845 RepID=UPI003D2875FF